MKSDLHIHSNCSDGSLSPEDVVKSAKEKGLDLIAVCDHDTTIGVKRAIAEGEKQNITVLSGVEVSAIHNNLEVHILGYNLDIDADGFDKEIEKLQNMREKRNKLLVEKLNAGGFEINYTDIVKNTHGSVGRPDIAKALVEKGYCESVNEAFEKYIGKGKPFHTRADRYTPCEAIEFINRFNGVAVLAHPKSLKMNLKELNEFVKTLTKCGLKGIEAEYFAHSKAERKGFIKIAKKYGLAITGGSDFHDKSHGFDIGGRSFSPTNFTKRVLDINDQTKIKKS